MGKVLVIGGAGMFGSRLCELLARDGADVTVAGRSAQPGGTVRLQQKGCPEREFAYRAMDRAGPLDGFKGFDVIVDAAGPFHAYGEEGGGDPYRVARAAIAAGAHYFDLCDNAEFCADIGTLDADARAAGVAVISGMSSVPAMSSAAVTAMCGGATPLSIDGAILPGNKAPRGRAVVESILNQTGLPYRERHGGRDVQVRSWSAPKTYDLGGYRRQGWRNEVPDQRLFPAHFDCPTVEFRAGLELGVMRYGLAAFSWLRSKLRFGMPDWLVSLVMVAANLLAPFGTDKGGMVVAVILPRGCGFVRKSWIMTATGGEGPYAPAVPIRAACRNLTQFEAGARPALSVLSLAAIEAAFDGIAMQATRADAPVVPIFRQVLGDAFDQLPNAVRDTHDAVTARGFRGRARVTRGVGMQARIAALLFGFPPTAEDIEVEVIKTPTETGERWARRFGGREFVSHLRAGPQGLSERFGVLTFELDLNVDGGRLMFPVRAGWAGPIPIPRFALPHSDAVETEREGRFHFDVHLKSPTGKTLVHYVGWLERDGEGKAG